ncbi:endospore germination permease [Oceanobacillus sp. J11TS1]|uniref:GerAB/ArcD/ProY family transporter n=1 Tax=Oceanobacillus sp. J11TS1 TaxID=2807191 RepID=UPI001AFDE99A|nr:endospore germination permease [Oceanobacillus sp. J11TS1]GIO24846.1 germination protein GerLB [Oceanobacillus sp. J11TS1]
MKRFKYGDERISERDIMVAIPSIVIGVGILSLPRDLAALTIGSDGWIPLLVVGLMIIFVCWAIAKFASGFPNQTFLTYASKIVTKPVAIVLTCLFAIVSIFITSFQIRKISNIAQQYLFDRTPIEVIALTFLLVVVYAVAGSRVGLFRINLLFMPIILFIACTVIVFNIGWFDFGNLLPVFQTPVKDYPKIFTSGSAAYLGVGILWFYLSLVDEPKKAPKAAALGMCIPVGLYILIFIMCIAVFGTEVTSNLLYPTVELAKVVEIPGGFFERFESVFFVIWIMAIFITATMAMDIGVFALNSIFKNTMKIKLIFICAPFIYLIAMFPKDVTELDLFGTILSNSIIILNLSVLILLPVVAKIRGVKRNE